MSFSPLRVRAIALALPIGLLLHADAALAQSESLRSPNRAAAPARTTLEGRVVGPDGAGVASAVVLSSAGGRAVSGADGTFRLELELTASAPSMQLTAFAGRGADERIGSKSLGSIAPGTSVRAGTILMQTGAGCEPDWLPTLGEDPGTGSFVYDLCVYDDGSGGGPALFVAGRFNFAGGLTVDRIARWDGQSWSQVGSGMDDDVTDLIVYDDGSGSGAVLVAGGTFTAAGGASANRLAQWDGAAWSEFGGGTNDEVTCLSLHDDGSGPALFVGGRFTSAGGVSASRIAKWDGSAWTALGAGIQHAPVYSMATFDDGTGSGPTLFVGGDFTVAGGMTVSAIANWDGTSWSNVGGGLSSVVAALLVHDDGAGGGPALYAGGGFTTIGGTALNRMARWDGASWSALGGGMNSTVTSLAVFDDGTGGGSELHAGGSFTTADGLSAKHIAKWNGAAWSALDSGIEGIPASVYCLATFDEGAGSGPALYAGGAFDTAGGLVAENIASWRQDNWSALGEGVNSPVLAFTVDETGPTPVLYAGGSFSTANSINASRVVRWDGVSWSPLGAGPSSTVNALCTFDDGGGGPPVVIAGGTFTSAGGVSANRVAAWDGNAWSALGSGVNSAVDALLAFDDGAGPALFAGGSFGIRKWNGASWSTLGFGTNNRVRALAVYDDGGGPALYVGGEFTSADGLPVNRIAKWDGTTWTALGPGLNNRVISLLVHDDGSGPALYAGGLFTASGGTSTTYIARWDGASWSPVGGGLFSTVHALTSFDDGSGPALIAGGNFTAAGGGVSAKRIAKWDGTSWSALGAGLENGVRALAVYDPGSGSAATLFAGGLFRDSPAGDSYLASWGGCSVTPGSAYCFGDGSGAACPCGNSAGPGDGCKNSTGRGTHLEVSGTSGVAADDLQLVASNLPQGQPALLFAGINALANGDGVAFGDGLRCTGGSAVRLGVHVPGADGTAGWGPGLSALGHWSAGDTRQFQTWHRDPNGGPCASGFNLSNAYEVSFTN